MRAKFYPVLLMLAAATSGAASDTSRAMVNTESVPIYAETSRSSVVVKTLAKGEAVTIAYTVATGEGDWCSMSDRAGYVLCSFLTREEPPKPETTAAPLPAGITTPAAPAAPPQQPVPQVNPHPPAEPALFTPEQTRAFNVAQI